MFELPKTISLSDKEYKIRNDGDFRMVLDCFAALNDAEMSKQERIMACLLIFYSDLNSIDDINTLPDASEAVQKMFNFFNCGTDYDKQKTTPYRIVDWENDAQCIASAVNNVAGREVRADAYLHWWTFIGYYMSIGESTFSTVVSIRQKIVKGQKLEKYENQFKNENPHYFVWDAKTAEQQEDDEWLRKVWNSD